MKYVTSKIIEHKVNLIIFFGLLFLTFLLFYKTLFFGFFSDDYHMLSIAARDVSVWKYFLTNLIGERGGHTYGPIYNVIFNFQFSIFNFKAAGYHIFTLFLHALNCFFVYLIAKRLNKKVLIGILSAVLFTVLQSHTSAVSWVAVQPHLIATFFYLLAIYFYLNFVQSKKLLLYIFAVLSAAFSIFTKEIGITFIALFFLIELFFGQKENFKKIVKRIALRFALPIGIIIVYLLLRRYTTGFGTGFYAQESLNLDIAQYIKMFVELTVNMFVSQPFRSLTTNWFFAHKIILSLIGISSISIIYFASKEFRKVRVFLFITYIVFSIPFLQVLYNPLTNEGERYTYLLSSIFAICFTLLVFSLFNKFKYTNYATIILIALFCIYSFGIMKGKLNDWQTANSTVNNTFEIIEENFFAKDEFIYFIGLPDNLNGAQLFRNGIFQALEIEKNLKNLKGERILIMTMLGTENFSNDIVELNKESERQYRLISKTEDILFTGLPKVEHEYVDFELKNFDRTYHTGSEIIIDLKKEKINELKATGKHIILVYFNKGSFQKMYLE